MSDASPQLAAERHGHLSLPYGQGWLRPEPLLGVQPFDLGGVDRRPAEREALANSLHAKLYKALSDHCQEAKGPGPGTFVMRVALVDPQESSAVMRTVSTYVPQAHLVNTLTSYAFNGGVSRWAGDATAEGYMKDSVTGALLWEGVDKRAGGNALGSNTFNSWGDVDAAGPAWAEQLTKRLQELGMCKQSS